MYHPGIMTCSSSLWRLLIVVWHATNLQLAMIRYASSCRWPPPRAQSTSGCY